MKFFDERIDVLAKLREDQQLHLIGQVIVDSLNNGGKIITCGNGGSAAEASHFATELMGRFNLERSSLPSLCLNSDANLITCIGNDYGFDKIFSHQLNGAITNSNDVVFCFTTSGNSKNIIETLKVAKAAGIDSVLVSGKSGGQAKGLADLELIIPSNSTAIVQECHLAAIHFWCHLIDLEFAN